MPASTGSNCILPLPRRDHDRKPAPVLIAGQMELGGQPSSAAPKPFLGRMLDPLFTSAWLGRRRAHLLPQGPIDHRPMVAPLPATPTIT